MVSISPAGALAACAVAATAICGAGVLTGVVQAPAGVTLFAPAAQAPLGWPEAVRLAKQASFGPTVPLVVHLVDTGVEGWLNEQFAAKSSTYADLAALTVPRNYCAAKTGTELSNCYRDYFTAAPVAMRFYANAATKDDQLRQRVAWALSQLLVASEVQVHSTAGVAAFNQILLDNAFGNYRDILKAVTLNPYMGEYLNLADSNRTAPNENYAREMMQLFSLGVNRLNPDGTLVKDAADAPVPTYTSEDVRGVARALTGWSHARFAGAPALDYNAVDFSRPMVAVAGRYDTTAKVFLGRTIETGTGQDVALDTVIDGVFNHANIAPYVSKYLIQQLVVSNPSPVYVGRISRVFADNGSGVRGDLKAVVRAILTDPEARTIRNTLTEGKVKEPVLLMTGLARAIGVTSTDGYAFTARDSALGQQPFRAPSVFNYYPPDYPLPLGDGLISPASKLMTTTTAINRHNFIYDWTMAGDSRWEFPAQATIAGSTGSALMWADWQALDIDTQLGRIELLLTEKGLNTAQRSALRAAMMAVTDKDPAVQARKRAQTGLYIAASSPLFQIDR
jgi:uncharacterized protein (DUF1800 family)